MKTGEFLKEVVTSTNGNLSSKRFLATILIFFGIAAPITCIFLEPIGVIDDSILILSVQFLVSGCSLLGFTLKEVKLPSLANRKSVNKLNTSPVYEDNEPEYNSSNVMEGEEVYEPEYTKRNKRNKCIG